MKKIKIGEEQCYILEGLDEMNYKRSLVFNQWSILVFEEQNHSLYELSMDRIKKFVNEGDYFSVINEVANNQFIKRLKEPSIDALGRCFALICLTEDETKTEADPMGWDDNHLKEKIDRWSKAGLTRGTIQSEFKNFLKASPDSYLPYLEKLTMMEALTKLITDQSLDTAGS